jgi:magnesium chelatase family protein
MAGDPDGTCTCPNGVPERYTGRISGPLRDRIDLWVTMPKVPPRALIADLQPESSAVVGARIAEARDRQTALRGRLNGRLSGRSLRAACSLSPMAARWAISLADLEALSGRGTERLLRVARTIADLAGDETVAVDHLDEAAQFRSPMAREGVRKAS